ncbi:FtsX-like permease family protein [Kitasatospora sp. NPDC056327]|uniref:FtsX-like permease family protein n=1 Tax=Kitasatospora sp. NPDC056327 TaxID=3345785 RepID=UPI0035E2B9B4
MTSPAATEAARPADAGPQAAHRPAAWVRTRLRAAPLAALLTAALAFGTVFLAAAFPRLLDRTADQGLREFLRDRGPAATSILASSDQGVDARGRAGDTGDPGDAVARLDKDAERLAAHAGILGVGPGGIVHGTRSGKARTLTDPGLARPDDADPTMALLYVQGLRDHVTLAEGRWPGTPAPGGPVPVALGRAAAETMGIRLGAVLHTGSIAVDEDAPRVEVVGILDVTDQNDPFWTELPCPNRACLNFTSGKLPAAYWHTAGLVDGSALDRVRAWQPGAQDFWRLPVDVDGLRADRLHEIDAELNSYLTGPTANELANTTARAGLRITSPLPSLLTQATDRQRAAAPLAGIGPAGLAGVGMVVLCLAAALTGDRRLAELRLLQARGGSRAGVVRRLLGENAVTVLPAAVAATALALLLLPTPRWGAALLAASAVAVFSLLALPLRAALLWSRPRPGAARRRLVAELAVLALTVAAVAVVRRRGVATTGADADPLLIVAPLLLALTGGLLLARLQPLLVGALGRVAAGRPGAVGFLGLARAARGTGDRRPSVLPLLALLLAVTTAGFGATVLNAVDSSRAHAARIGIGGDASVVVPIGVTVPPAFAEAAAALPGIRASAPLWADTEVFVLGDSGAVRVFAVVADPAAYAEISRSLGLGAFDPAALSGGTGGPDAPVPALVSTALAQRLGPTATHRLRLPNGGELLTRTAATVDGTPALQGEGRLFVVLPAGPAVAVAPELGRANLWLATGSVDEGELRKLVRERIATGAQRTARVDGGGGAGQEELPAGYSVRTSAGVTAELGDDPLQTSAARLFWTAVVGAGALALIAVLLTLVRAAPERTALLARLRTMGLRPRQGLALILVETLPQTLVAAIGGGLTALGAVALLGPAFDLSVLVGVEIPRGLPVDVPPVLLQTAGLAALVSAGVVAEALVAGRRQIATELRAGDQR